jgi:hypothetical protein
MDNFGGIEPGPDPIHKYSKIETPPTLSECKKCGKLHGMVLEEMATGKTGPLDICKDCMFYATAIPLTDQIHLTEMDADEFVKNHEEFINDQMNKLLSYALRQYYSNWLLYGIPEHVPHEYPLEVNEMYEKAYKACQDQWSESQIDQRFCEMKFLHDPPEYTENRWKDMLKRLADSMKKSQKEYNDEKNRRNEPIISPDL